MNPHVPTAIACNAAAPVPADRLCALNFELPLGEDGSLPEWVELLPPGREVKGRDGRAWVNDRPEGILAAFNADFGPIPIGYGHAIELAPPTQAPAAVGWIEELEQRDGGALWGRVSWNNMGRYAVASREHRYLSPTFVFDKESRRILQLLAAGLTNWPNLPLAALNERQPTPISTDIMNEFLKSLAQALGLPDTATEPEVLTAVNALKAERDTAVNAREIPPLDKFVPRAEYDTAVNARQTAETRLAEREKADLERGIEAEISAALQGKKITPATADYYRAMCAQEGGLERFKEFVGKAPVLAADSMIQGDPAQGGGARLAPDELAVCQQMGLTEEQFLAAKGEARPTAS